MVICFVVPIFASLVQTHMKHTSTTLPPFVPLSGGVLVCFRPPLGPRLAPGVAFFLSVHYIITSACVFEVGRGPSLGKLLWTKGSLPFLFNPCMWYTTAWGHEARLQTLDSAHLRRVTNYDNGNILSGSAEVQWGTWFPCFVLFFIPAPNQSSDALLNVNKVFTLLTQSEGLTEMTICSL